MRRAILFAAVLAAGLRGEPYTAGSLAAELRRIEAGGSSGARLPEAWQVQTAEGRYSIPTEPLRKAMEAGRAAQAKGWLGALAGQLEGYGGAADRQASGARERLKGILARSEFNALRPASAVETWRRKVMAWFQDLVRRVVRALAGNPTASQFLFWILAAATVGLLAVWLVRWWGREREMPRAHATEQAEVAARAWQEWLAEAHGAAAEGDWPRAIHGVYWAGVGWLQQSGTLPADLTRTPREYLRLVSGHRVQDPLAGMTAGLERFWYARRAAKPEDFRETLTQLEALGCRLE